MHAIARRSILAAATTIAAAGLVLASAAPALARTIPSGDAMYAISCEDIMIGGYSVDSTTAAADFLGEVNPVSGQVCARQAAYDAVTGRSYFVDQRDLQDPTGPFYQLWEFFPATGLSAEIETFHTADDTPIEVLSMAIGVDGAAYAIDFDNNLYSLDLATAEVTLIVALGPGQQMSGFAVDPTTGQFWVAPDQGLRTIDVTTGALGVASPFAFPDGTSIQSLQVDSAGVFWVLNSPMEADPPTELWSRTAVEGTNEFSGDVNVDSEPVDSESLLIIPAPQPALPATGSDSTMILVGGLGVLLIGGALLLVRRRTV